MEEREIDLFDLIADILVHWRSVLIAMIVGAVLLGVFGYVKSYKEFQNTQNEQVTVSTTQDETAREEKIERMATDENYRKQYEGIIKNAASGLSQLKSQIESSGQSQNVVGYGMKVNDGGTASFFAVLKKSSADQKARIEKKAVEKKEAKKAEEKKAEKKEKQDKLKEAQQTSDDDDTITISAGSIEELIKKINDYTFSMKSDNVQTEAELQVGQHIDFRG